MVVTVKAIMFLAFSRVLTVLATLFYMVVTVKAIMFLAFSRVLTVLATLFYMVVTVKATMFLCCYLLCEHQPPPFYGANC